MKNNWIKIKTNHLAKLISAKIILIVCLIFSATGNQIFLIGNELNQDNFVRILKEKFNFHQTKL